MQPIGIGTPGNVRASGAQRGLRNERSSAKYRELLRRGPGLIERRNSVRRSPCNRGRRSIPALAAALESTSPYPGRH